MSSDILVLGITFGFVGKVLLGLAVIFVHHKIVIEHKIDNKVLTEMRREARFALLGIIFMSIGFILEMAHYGYIPFF